MSPFVAVRKNPFRLAIGFGMDSNHLKSWRTETKYRNEILMIDHQK